MIANAITLIRVVLALVALLLLPLTALSNFVAIGLIVISMLLDALDGYIARLTQLNSVNGSIYDILADRIIENIFFIYFAGMSLFSVWLAIIMLIRGLVIDAIRTLHVSAGKTAFGVTTLQIQPWTKWLTGSRITRGTYNTSKLLMFICYGALLEPHSYLFSWFTKEKVTSLASATLWLTLIIALLRAIPVIIDGWLRRVTIQRA